MFNMFFFCNQIGIHDCVAELRQLEQAARDSYKEFVNIDNDQFMLMMVLDIDVLTRCCRVL